MSTLQISVLPNPEEVASNPNYKEFSFFRKTDNPCDFAIALKQALEAYSGVPFEVILKTPEMQGFYTSEVWGLQQEGPKSKMEIN